jgi:hypothetical protein
MSQERGQNVQVRYEWASGGIGEAKFVQQRKCNLWKPLQHLIALLGAIAASG